ncbi:MAG: LacI family transcriptional regulator [Lachnospiraceae bacterium]|nr:LacI family transcriptional regulator [Lachnospiraceae bacterium]
MTSMKDIAAACGVSIATVSKALNGHHDIGEKTRARIRKAAEEMGYSPNSFASALKTRKSYNVGVLFVDEDGSGLTHDHFSRILDSVKVSVESNGYDLTFLNCNKNREKRRSYLNHTRYRGLEGIIIACIDFSDPEVAELIESEIPVVTIDCLFDNTMCVMTNQAKGMRDLMNYIYEMGHRRIAYIHGTDSAVTQSRLNGFYQTIEELKLTVPKEYIREVAYRDKGETERLTKELLNLETPPTCILYPDDYASFGGIKAIKEMGLKIPEDISIAGYDGIVISRLMEPQLTTIDQDAEKIGRCAGDALIKIIENPKTTIIETIRVDGNLVIGNSVGKI